MIQFRTLFLSVFGLFMMACAREEIIVSETSVQDTPIGMQAQKGRLRLKFKSRFAGKAEQAVYTRAGTGDIRIVMVTHSTKAASSAGRVMFIKDGEVFHQLYRGNDTNQQFYQRISDTLTLLTTGGEVR